MMENSLEDLNSAILNRDVKYIQDYLEIHIGHGCLDRTALSVGLLKATELDMFPIVEYILRSCDSVDVNYEDHVGNNSICIAITRGNFEILKLLVENGARVCIESGKSCDWSMIPVHLAADTDQTKILEYLLQHGAHVNVVDKMGSTALHRAIKRNHPNSVRVLLKYGSCLKPIEGFNMTPLCSAIMVEAVEIVDLLLNYGANPNDPDTSGMEMGTYSCTLLHTAQMLKASSAAVSSAILRMLLNAGAQVNVVDSYDYTPLQHCIRKANIGAFNFENMKLLVQSGAKLESIHRKIYFKYYKPESSLRILQCYGQWDAVRHLVTAGWELHREPCIDDVIEVASKHDVILCDTIRSLHMHPRPLTDLCRYSLREHLLYCTNDRSISERVSKLPLPNKLIQFL